MIRKATVRSGAIILCGEQWNSDRHSTGDHVGGFVAFIPGCGAGLILSLGMTSRLC